MADLNKVMKNQCQSLSEKQQTELLKILQNSKSYLIEYLATGKISSRLLIKRGCEADMSNTISST